MHDSQVLNYDNVPQSNYNSRSGQVSWLDDNEEEDNQFLNSLNARIESLTGHTTKTAEDFQVVNYGLGGHYIPHYDMLSSAHVNICSSMQIRNCFTRIIVFYSQNNVYGVVVCSN